MEQNLRAVRVRETDAEKVQKLQRGIYLKAKAQKDYKFYSLMDKVYILYILKEAYRKVKANGGCAGIDKEEFSDIEGYGKEPGIDGVTYESIETQGKDEYIQGIIKELREGTYKPQPVKRVFIPKANGKLRPLGIPVIKDRIIQMACKMVIEPIFEADFEDCSHGFRPKRNAEGAMKEIKANLRKGKEEIFDADLSSYFDTIPHDKLMLTIEKRITDRKILKLIWLWLKAPVNENGKMSGGKKNKVGTPQGGVISPLLSNIYLNLVDQIVKRIGSTFAKAGVTIVRYADDFVLMGRKITDQVKGHLGKILNNMELKLNEEKSRVVNAKEENFDFLGFTVGKAIHFKTREEYYKIEASQKSQKKIREKLSEKLEENRHINPQGIVKILNQTIRGWVNYFTMKGTSQTTKVKYKLKQYVNEKLRKYYKKKSQKKSGLCSYKVYDTLSKHYGLYQLYHRISEAPLKA